MASQPKDKLELSKIISFIKSHKSTLEVSQYEGDIFWLNNMCFGPAAHAHHYHHISVYPGDKPGIYFSIADTGSYPQAAEIVIKKYRDGDHLKKDFYKQQNNIISTAKRLLKSNPQDKTAYIAIANAFISFSKVSVFSLEALDYYLNSLMQIKIVDPKELALLTTSGYTSYANQCEEDLRRISKISDKKSFMEQAQKHIIEWDWAYTNYKSSAQLSVTEIEEKIQNLVDVDLAVEKSIKDKLEKKNIILAQKSKEVQNLIKFFDATLELRDQRKATLLRCVSAIRGWLNSYAEFYQFDQHKIRFLTWQEQLALDDHNKKQLLEIAENRLKGCTDAFGFKNDESPLTFIGDEHKLLVNAIFDRKAQTELQGTTACAGCAKGKVKIINTTHDFKNFCEGDILVSSHTTPDYLCVMKKAKAILTERGGITSHAALVSRELPKPCIVGIRGLIDSLQDGDMIEIDANNGIVKRLK